MNNDLKTKIQELIDLEDGWYDGFGKAPSKEKITWLYETYLVNYPSNLPLPAIFPTKDGDLLFGWRGIDGLPSLDLNLTTLVGCFDVVFYRGVGRLEEFYDLNDPNEWEESLRTIEKLIVK